MTGKALPQLPAGLLTALPRELADDARSRDLFARFLAVDGYGRELAFDLVEIASGAAGDAWEVRRIAALMLQEQVLRLRDDGELIPLLDRIGFLPTDPCRSARQLRRRLARAEPVLRRLRRRPVPADAWRDFLHLASRECKLPLARYLFSAAEVAERIFDHLRVSHGVERGFAAGRPYVDVETERALGRLPAYEAEILERLAADWWIHWVGDATPAEINSLIEYPLTTVVLVVKPPGSDRELELKRAGRRGGRPLDAVFARRGAEVPPPHRFDGASLGRSLQWEVIAGSLLARLYRMVHRREAPISHVLSMSTLSSIPAASGDVALLDYFTLPQCFGKGFRRMRRDLQRTVEAFDRESGDSLDELQGALGLTVRFLQRGSLAQTILCGTSSFRLDKVALYLSEEGPGAYFRQGLRRRFRDSDARRLADEVLEEALGLYQPPPVPYRGHEAYVTAALALSANRARADRVYLSLMRQIGTFWGVLAAAKGQSRGESFVARNVGLRSVWRSGRWQVEMLFMDHDSLRLGGARADDFHPVETTEGMRDDERFILGGGSEAPSICGEVEILDQIYRVSEDVAREGRAALFAAFGASCAKTRATLAAPGLREHFSPAFLARIRDWDALVGEYARCAEPPEGEALKALVDGFLGPRGHEDYFLDECAAALEEFGRYLALSRS
ncbi:MAG TPA: hypothetical protein VEW48_23025 [Thermoanaerobaculia bacterium]|nr:hypothetical protein [Thermoanaerobaculia bacterium]